MQQYESRDPRSFIGHSIRISVPWRSNDVIYKARLWLRVQAVRGQNLMATLESDPVDASSFELGDLMEVRLDQIEAEREDISI